MSMTRNKNTGWFSRYAKLGTKPYGILVRRKEPKVGERFTIPSIRGKRYSTPVPVIVSRVTDDCVFLTMM